MSRVQEKSNSSTGSDPKPHNAFKKNKKNKKANFGNESPLLDLVMKNYSEDQEEEKSGDKGSRKSLMQQQGEISSQTNMMLLNSVQFSTPNTQLTNGKENDTGKLTNNVEIGIQTKEKPQQDSDGNNLYRFFNSN